MPVPSGLATYLSLSVLLIKVMDNNRILVIPKSK